MPKIEAWGDGSKGSAGVTTSWVNGETIVLGHDNELHYYFEFSGTDATAIDLRLQVSFDEGDNWLDIDLPVVSIRGDKDEEHLMVHAPARSWVRLGLKRRGGGVLTAAYVGVVIRQQIADWRFENYPLEVNYAVALDDGSGGDLTLTGAYQYGDDIEVGHGDLLELYLIKSGSNSPDEVLIAVEKSIDNGTTDYPIDQIDSVVAGEATHSASIVKATDIDATDGLYRAYTITNITPLTTIRVGAKYSGGTAPDVQIFARIVRK